MLRYLRAEGRAALGCILGIILSIAAAFTWSYWPSNGNISIESYYTLMGAGIAALVGVVGQIMVIAADEWRDKVKSDRESKAVLYEILSNGVKSLSVFVEWKQHFESVSEGGSIWFESIPPLSKPIFASDTVREFSLEATIEALRIKDMQLVNLLNDANSIISNYLKLYPIFSLKFGEFAEAKKGELNFDMTSGRISGVAELDKRELFGLYDLQNLLTLTVYTGIPNMIDIIDKTRAHLVSAHGEAFSFTYPLAEEEIQEIRDSLEPA